MKYPNLQNQSMIIRISSLQIIKCGKILLTCVCVHCLLKKELKWLALSLKLKTSSCWQKVAGIKGVFSAITKRPTSMLALVSGLFYFSENR